MEERWFSIHLTLPIACTYLLGDVIQKISQGKDEEKQNNKHNNHIIIMLPQVTTSPPGPSAGLRPPQRHH